MRIWRVCVEVPAEVDADGLFDALADAAFEWQPADRDGWDISMYASQIEIEDDAD